MRQLRFGRFWRTVDTVLLVLAVVTLVVPSGPDPLDTGGADKIYHIVGFALLATWAALLLEPRAALVRRAVLLLTIGAGTELLQIWLPGREGDPLDLMANAVGILLGSISALMPVGNILSRLERLFVGAVGPPPT